MAGKFRLAEFEVADETDNHGIVLRKIEYPLVVPDPTAGLDHNGADYTMPFSQAAEVLRQMRLIQWVSPGRPRHALRPRRIIKVCVGVNYRHRCRSRNRRFRPGKDRTGGKTHAGMQHE